MIALSLVLAIGFGELADRLARPRRALLAGSGTALIVRAAIIAWVWLLAFGLTVAFSLPTGDNHAPAEHEHFRGPAAG